MFPQLKLLYGPVSIPGSSTAWGHVLAVGGEFGQNVAHRWCPAEDSAGVGGGDALVEGERVG